MRFLKTYLNLWYLTCGDFPKRLHGLIYPDSQDWILAQISQISAKSNALN